METKPRLIQIKGGGTGFIHPCEICGGTGPFGRDVKLGKGKPGRWRCFEHRWSHAVGDLPPVEPQTEPAPEPAPSPAIASDLFT